MRACAVCVPLCACAAAAASSTHGGLLAPIKLPVTSQAGLAASSAAQLALGGVGRRPAFCGSKREARRQQQCKQQQGCVWLALQGSVCAQGAQQPAWLTACTSS